MSNSYKEQFLKASEDWVCDACSIDIRYVAKKEGEIKYLVAASIGISPRPPAEDLGFCLENRLGVAIRTVPGVGVKSRKQVTSEIKWKSARKGVREGQARIRLDKADSVLTMFVIGDITVRRQWLLDPTKVAIIGWFQSSFLTKNLR